MNNKWNCLILIITILATGCAKKGELHFASSSDLGSQSLKCDDRSNVGASDMRRLSKAAYQNSIRDFFGSTILSQITTELAAIPGDQTTSKNMFDTMPRGISSSQLDNYFYTNEKVADLVMASSVERAKVNSCLATIDTATVAQGSTCLSSVLNDFGKRVYRRPLTATESSEKLSLYQLLITDGQPVIEAAKGVLMSLLNSPFFMYVPEVAGTATTRTDVLQLDPYEVATRLSLLIWNSSPDATLLGAAGAGQLTTPDQIQIQVDRMIADARFADALRNFVRSWLMLDATKDINQSASFLAGQDVTGLKAAMILESEKFVMHHLQNGGRFADLMTSDISFIQTPQLAAVYQVAQPSNGTGMTNLNPAIRGGLITRAAKLSDGRDESSPVHRGTYIKRHILCDDLPDPDPSSLPGGSLTPPPIDPSKSARERWTVKTSPAACIGCHSQINALGFALEKFDSIGRARSIEVVRDSSGVVLANIPIDDVVDVAIDPGKPVRISGPLDLSRALAQSKKANQCFAKQWFRFSHGRLENWNEDGCVVQDMETTMNQTGGSAVEAFKKMVLSPEFVLVKLKP